MLQNENTTESSRFKAGFCRCIELPGKQLGLKSTGICFQRNATRNSCPSWHSLAAILPRLGREGHQSANYRAARCSTVRYNRASRRDRRWQQCPERVLMCVEAVEDNRDRFHLSDAQLATRKDYRHHLLVRVGLPC